MNRAASTDEDHLAAGSHALESGRWTEAREHFEKALAVAETAEAWEGLGTAAWWLADQAVVFRARGEAYRLYREGGCEDGAARVALMLAWNQLEFRGAPAVANGWVQLAHRHLVVLEEGPEWAMFHLFEGHRALMDGNDVELAKEAAARATSIGTQLGSVDLEMLGIAVAGLALVTEGRIAEGMARLDEAAAAASGGLMTDPDAIGSACCYLIYGCERVRDYARAAQWCRWLEEFSVRWGHRPLLGICRAHYGAVLMHQGRWQEAEEHLHTACEQLGRELPPLAVEAVVRLGELRRRQGRLDEAHELFTRAGGHPLAEVGLATVALDRQDHQRSLEQSERCLRHIPSLSRTERVAALEAAVRARLASGDVEGARAASAELTAIADGVATDATRASALFAEALVMRQEGKLAEARAALERAAQLFGETELPYEAAMAEAELAAVARASEQPGAAERALSSALSRLQHIGAVVAAQRLGEQLVEALPAAGPPPTQSLSPRELEVLKLIALGLSDRAMAQRLALSEHTVHRHASNLLSKLGVSTRAAAVAEGGRQGLL